MKTALIGLLVVGLLVLAGCAGSGSWNQRDEVDRARFSAERSMMH